MINVHHSLFVDQSMNIIHCSLIIVDRWLCEHERVRVDVWMSGWCPSFSGCGMAVGVLLLSCPVRWCGSRPTHPIAVLASTAVMSHSVPCQVLWCAGGECVCGVRVVGYPLCAPPLVVVEGGAVVDGGVA